MTGRWQIDRWHDDGRHTTQAVTVPKPELTAAETAAVEAVLEPLTERDFGQWAVLLLERMFDRDAYIREAERRGVLPL